jgi:hypothetical protein
LHFYCGLRIRVQSAIDHVGPVHEFSHRGRIESEALLRDHRNEAGARLEGRIVKLFITLVPLKVSRVGSGEKRALMMVEPPGNLGRAGVLEVDDRIFVTIEMRFVKQRSGSMQEAGKNKVRITADALAVKAGEERRGAGSVKALVMIENSDFQSIPQLPRIPALREAEFQLLAR